MASRYVGCLELALEVDTAIYHPPALSDSLPARFIIELGAGPQPLGFGLDGLQYFAATWDRHDGIGAGGWRASADTLFLQFTMYGLNDTFHLIAHGEALVGTAHVRTHSAFEQRVPVRGRHAACATFQSTS